MSSHRGFRVVELLGFRLWWSNHVSTNATGNQHYRRYHLFFRLKLLTEWGGSHIYRKHQDNSTNKEVL